MGETVIRHSTPVGAIAVREVHPAMLPAGRWWWLVPASLAGEPMVLTSDPDRLVRELNEAAKTWLPGEPAEERA